MEDQKTPDLTIDQNDLKVLFAHTHYAYGNLGFDQWCIDCKKSYISYLKDRENPLTYTQWVNGQILFLQKYN